MQAASPAIAIAATLAPQRSRSGRTVSPTTWRRSLRVVASTHGPSSSQSRLGSETPSRNVRPRRRLRAGGGLRERSRAWNGRSVTQLRGRNSSTTIAPKPGSPIFRTVNISWSSCGAERSQPSASHRKHSRPKTAEGKPKPLRSASLHRLSTSMVRRGSTVRVRQRAYLKCLQSALCCCLSTEHADTFRTHLRYARRTATSRVVFRHVCDKGWSTS